MKRKISTQVSVGFCLIVLLTVSAIWISANLLIEHQFEQYVTGKRQQFSSQLAESLKFQYDAKNETWNVDYIHGMGMYALNDGYLITVYDKDSQEVWDAENHDMTLCHQIMQNIRTEMEEKRPKWSGNLTTYRYEIRQNDQLVGYLDVSYYAPYYYSESDFRFLDSLNWILFLVGIVAIVATAAAGVIFARRLSIPLLNVIEVTRKMSDGNYDVGFAVDRIHTRELAELSSSVNQMAENLKRQETLRRRLTSDVAHELRTPVTNASLNMEMFLEGVWEPTKERLQSCYEELGRISSMIADLEKLRQVEDEQLILEQDQVDLLKLTRNMCRTFDPELQKKHLTYTLDGESLVVSGDGNRLRQVVMNLFSNAVKYSLEGGQIQIWMKDLGNEGCWVIEDHGIGIAKEDQALIFERFYRTDLSRSRKTGGAGIGLTIVKAIVQAHHGTITVESQVGRGSKFTVILPKNMDEKDTCKG